VAKEKILGDKLKKKRDLRGDYFKSMGQSQEPWASLSFQAWLTSAGSRPTRKMVTPGLMKDKDNEWLGGTPDALLGDDVVVEFKTRCFPDCLTAEPITSVPSTYYMQVQTYLQVCDRPKGVLYCWTWENGVSIWRILRDQVLFGDFVMGRLRKFWEQVRGMKSSYESGEMGSQDEFEKTAARVFRAWRGEGDLNCQLVVESMNHSLQQIHDPSEI
jgi:hypothetical protein